MSSVRLVPAPSRSDGTEKKNGPPKLELEMLGHLALLNHGRKLVEISEHDEAEPAERLAGTSAIDAERLVDGPHEVGAHHRHFVYDEELEAAHHGAVAAAPDILGADEAGWKPEERVERLSADVDGREPRRRDHGEFAGDHVAERAQKRGLAGPRAPGDEQVPLAAAQEIDGGGVFVRRRHAGGPRDGGR